MIVPITEDAVWLRRLEDIGSLELLAKPVTLIAPHPDDETLGAGALIATLRSRGIPVTVIAATDGENAYDMSVDERVALGAVREREQREALAVLGVESSAIKRLRQTDSCLANCEAELTHRISEHVLPDTTLIAPWVGDFHPDHEACARAAAAVASAKGLCLIYYFFWTWHRGSPSLLDGMQLRRFNPSQAALTAKALALTKYQSQMENSGYEGILSERLLAPARWPFEVFLSA